MSRFLGPDLPTTRRPVRPAARHALVAILAVSVVALTACSSSGRITPKSAGSPTTSAGSDHGEDDSEDGGPPSFGTVRWDDCDPDDIAVSEDVFDSAEENGMQCATIAVPVDHAEPSGPTIDLALGRLPATGRRSERIGSLVVNPGGPGGSGLEFLAASGLGVPTDLRDRFDIVSFDPRGVAASSPLDCLSEQQRAERVDTQTSTDPAVNRTEAAELEESIAEGCLADDADLYANMGTDEVAADLDDIRAAVGDDGLTFLGLSYGTRIAAAYAHQFPDNVRALVLDGSVTPSRDLVDSQSGQVRGIVRAFEAFVAACDADAACPLAPDTGAALDARAAALEAQPVVVRGDDGDDDESLTKDKFVVGVITSLYDPSMSMALAEAVASLGGNDPDRAELGASFILDLAGRQSAQRPDGSYGNGFETQTIVNCLDADGPLGTEELPRVRELAGPIPALLDSDPAADAPSCQVLPTGTDLVIGPTGATDRLLVVGTEGDPATPIEWTAQMVEALGDPASITYGGSGHTASLTRSCVTDQVVRFLVDAAVPPDLVDCPRDPDESDVYAQIAGQFETMGLGAEVGRCIAEALRREVDALSIVSLNGDDPDMAIVRELQNAAMSCR